MRRGGRRSLVILAIAVALVAYVGFDLGRFLSFEALKQGHAALSHWRSEHAATAATAYFAGYVLAAALSIPGAAVLTLAGGAIFGVAWGTLLAVTAATAGAGLAFLSARLLFADAVRRRFPIQLARVDRGIARDGAFYLFTLRLVPLFPYVLVNLLSGLTRLRLPTFLWVSLTGMLPATLVYVNAGTQIAQLESPAGILSPELIGSFALLGLFPWLARAAMGRLTDRRALRGQRRPRRFDRDLVVIGAGSAGLVTAYVGAALRAQVTLVERARMGGDCLNTGCVPSKALIRTARFLADARRARDLGVRRAEVEVDFGEVMARVRRVIRTIEPHDSVERYAALGVDCVAGTARIVSPWEVSIDGRTLTTRGIVVATGARPFVPPLPGLAQSRHVTSDTVWDLTALPPRLVVLGGGPIGCELAQCFARLGSAVTIVESAHRLLPREDARASAVLATQLQAEGLRLQTGTQAVAVQAEDGTQTLVCTGPAGGEVRIGHDLLLVALGRRARTEDLGLEALGIGTTSTGTIEIDGTLRTRIPTIRACGDVAGPYQFTHVASHQAGYAAINALLAPWWQLRVDYSAIPWTTFTDPEVAHVGLNEDGARAQGVAYEVTEYDVGDLDRAIADEAATGFVKVLTAPGRDRILGVTIVAAHAGDMLPEFVAAMRNGHGLGRILGAIHVYPTFGEANRYAAGAWKRAHAPAGALRLLERVHAWRRG